MIGAAISPKMRPAFSTPSPNGTSKVWMISGFMIDMPTNPHTTEGIAASISTRIFRVSRVLPVANSAMKSAAPSDSGTEKSIANPVTLAVPTMSASAPYVGLLEVGRHAIDVKNSHRLSGPRTKSTPSFVTKTKIPRMKMIAEMPPTKTSHWATRSTYHAASLRSIAPSRGATLGLPGAVTRRPVLPGSSSAPESGP